MMSHLHDCYTFATATADDFEEIVELCSEHFVKDEPHCRALGITPEEHRDLFKWLIAKSLHSPFSVKVTENSTKQIIAIRACSLANRDSTADWQPYPLEQVKITKKQDRLETALEHCMLHFWEEVDPSVQRTLHQEVVMVTAAHLRRGIAREMLEWGLDSQEMKSFGIQGISSEATSLANQTLLARNGYTCIYDYADYSLAKELDDGTTGIKVFFKGIEKINK